MSRKHIAMVLKRLRKNSGMTADQVGEILGRSGKTINGWENNRGQPDAETLLQLCAIYKVKDVRAEFLEDIQPESQEDFIEGVLLENFRKLNADGRNMVIRYVRDLKNSGNYTDNPQSKNA